MSDPEKESINDSIPKGIFLTPEDFFNHLRKQVEHEDNLINQRANWLLVSQGFLFFALSQLVTAKGGVSLLLYVIAGFAFLSSLSVLSGIRTAGNSIQALKNTWEKTKDQIQFLEQKNKLSILEVQLSWHETNPVLRFFYLRGLWIPILSLVSWLIVLGWLMFFYRLAH